MRIVSINKNITDKKQQQKYNNNNNNVKDDINEFEEIKATRSTDIKEKLIGEVINLQFKNINNIFLILLNCIMPTALIVFFTKREIFNTLEFPKLILLILPINIILLYSLSFMKFYTSDFKEIYYILKAEYIFMTLDILNIKLNKLIFRLQKDTCCSKNPKYLKKCNHLRKRSYRKIKQGKNTLVKIKGLKTNLTMNYCIKHYMLFNIYISLIFLIYKAYLYILDVKASDKQAFLTIVFWYIIINLNVILKMFFKLALILLNKGLEELNRIIHFFATKKHHVIEKEEVSINENIII